jgi:hypothetical protein
MRYLMNCAGGQTVGVMKQLSNLRTVNFLGEPKLYLL